MENIYIVLLLVVIVLLVSNKNNSNHRLERLEERLTELNTQLKEALSNRPAEIRKPTPQSERPWEAPRIAPPQPITDIPPLAPKPVIVPDKMERDRQVIIEPSATPNIPVRPTSVPPPPRKPYVAPEPELSFFEKHPDLEKFIGENLINKIGIAILVLAIGFFVKYAIDNNWVGPIGRVGIGVMCGGILIGIAHKLRNSYTAFSSVLVGGGLAILYFTITLAYHQFHLFGQTASFIILIVITIFAVVLSLLYNKQELAVIALVGGLASPFMVSSGQANFNALFIYLVILNAGLVVIAYYKSWRILNAIVFGLTIIVFGAVLTQLTAPTYHTGFLYASILYLLFFTINVANNVKENKAFVASDFSILLINTSLYFAVGLYLLTAMQLENLRGVFSASLAVINLLLSFLLFKNRKVDTNILYLLIGITITFISLTAPIQLNGHYITLFWAAETVLLYWLYLKSKITLMKLTALIVWAAMVISLLMDWYSIYNVQENVFMVMANKGFVTTLIAAIGSYLLHLQIQRDESPQLYKVSINAGLFKNVGFILFFASGFLEVNHQFSSRYPYSDLNTLYLMLYIPAFVYVFLIVIKKFGKVPINWRVDAALTALAIIIYLLSTWSIFQLKYTMLKGQINTAHFAAHWTAAVFIGLLFYRLIQAAAKQWPDRFIVTSSWVLTAAVVLFLSLELCLASNMLFASATLNPVRVQTVYNKVGLPIIWGLSSFALMIIGMRNKARTLRVISLTLFALTLVKLFVFDIKNIPPAGKIAAFFCLGVILLIVSFMYQKVKKILADDETNKIPDEE